MIQKKAQAMYGELEDLKSALEGKGKYDRSNAIVTIVAGAGSLLMQTIIKTAKQTWTEVVRIQLTSRPSRDTAEFFEKCGFKARTKENDDETIVYVKDFGEYHS